MLFQVQLINFLKMKKEKQSENGLNNSFVDRYNDDYSYGNFCPFELN